MSQDPWGPGGHQSDPRRSQDPGWDEPTRQLGAPYEPTLPYPPGPSQQQWSSQSPYQPQPFVYQASAPSQPPEAGWSWTPPEERSAKGTVSLCLAIIAVVISSILSWIGGMSMARLIMMDDGSWDQDVDYATFDPTTEAEFMRSVYTFLGQLVPTGLGIAALVIGILACQHRSSRGTGIAAIIISVIAPMLSCFVFIVAMVPILEG